MASQNVLSGKFTLNQLHLDFIKKWGKRFVIYGSSGVLQVGQVLKKWDNFFVLQSWATGITK